MKYLALAVLLVIAQRPAKTASERITEGEGSKVSSKADKTQNKDDATADANGRSQAILYQYTSPSSKTDASAANQDTEIQRKIKIFTGLLVAVGAVQAIVMVLQWLTYRRQAKFFERSERAWVMVDIDWQPKPHIVEGISDGVENTGIFVTLTCTNVGKSFAQITEKGYVLKIFSDHPPRRPDFTDIERFQITSEYLPPNAATQPYKLSAIICEGRRGGDQIMFLYGRVDYRDVYGEHKTAFGYMVSPNGDLVRLPTATYPDYNQHT